MTARPIRSTRHNSYPALMVFGLVYLAALAIVIAPDSLRADRSAPPDATLTGGLNVHLYP